MRSSRKFFFTLSSRCENKGNRCFSSQLELGIEEADQNPVHLPLPESTYGSLGWQTRLFKSRGKCSLLPAHQMALAVFSPLPFPVLIQTTKSIETFVTGMPDSN